MRKPLEKKDVRTPGGKRGGKKEKRGEGKKGKRATKRLPGRQEKDN